MATFRGPPVPPLRGRGRERAALDLHHPVDHSVAAAAAALASVGIDVDVLSDRVGGSP